jgi:hypothetical protein
MVRSILRFRAAFIVGTAILVGAVLAVAPVSASAVQTPRALPAAQAVSLASAAAASGPYYLVNNYNYTCLNGREGEDETTEQPCDSTADPQELWWP